MSKKSEKSLEESLNQKPEDLLSEIKSETVTVDQANPNRLYLAAKQVHVDTSQFKKQEAIPRRREGKGKRKRRRTNKRRNSKRHSKRRTVRKYK